MNLTVSHDFLPKRPSTLAAVVMDHFGIGFETGRHVIAEDLELPIEPGDVVCFTGESGSGKSSLMRAAAERLAADLVQERGQAPSQDSVERDNLLGRRSQSPFLHQHGVLDIDALDLGDRILVEALELPVQDALPLLAGCGLGEARLLLRSPRELSDGQRYRFRLAMALARKPAWIVADEFTATLDRTLAKVVAFNVRRLADRTGTGFLLATTHEDILDDLHPSLHVRCHLDGRIDIQRPPAFSPPLPGGVSSLLKNGRARLLPSQSVAERLAEWARQEPRPPGSPPLQEGVRGGEADAGGAADPPGPPLSREGERRGAKKKAPSASPANWRSPPAKHATGRTLLGGIIAVIGSESCGT